MSENYQGRSDQRLLDLANTTNSTSYALGVDLNFGTIGQIDEDGFNTRVRVNPIKSIYSPQWLRLRRLSLAIMQPLADVMEPIEVFGPVTSHDLLDQVNQELQLDLTTEEVELTTFDTASDSLAFNIAGPIASFAWLQSGINIKVKLSEEDTTGYRLMEDGSPRLMEDGTPRLLETEDEGGGDDDELLGELTFTAIQGAFPDESTPGVKNYLYTANGTAVGLANELTFAFIESANPANGFKSLSQLVISGAYSGSETVDMDEVAFVLPDGTRIDSDSASEVSHARTVLTGAFPAQYEQEITIKVVSRALRASVQTVEVKLADVTEHWTESRPNVTLIKHLSYNSAVSNNGLYDSAGTRLDQLDSASNSLPNFSAKGVDIQKFSNNGVDTFSVTCYVTPNAGQAQRRSIVLNGRAIEFDHTAYTFINESITMEGDPEGFEHYEAILNNPTLTITEG